MGGVFRHPSIESVVNIEKLFGVQVGATPGAGMGGDPIAAVGALSPVYLYVPTVDYATVDGSTNISTLRDYMHPGVAARELVQADPGKRPAWLATSGLPSGCPAVQGDNIDDYLVGNVGSIPSDVANYGVSYLLMRSGPGAVGSQETAVAFGSDVDAIWRSEGAMNNTPSTRRGGAGNVGTGSSTPAGTPFWLEVERIDGAAAIYLTDSLGGTNSYTRGLDNFNRLTMCAFQVLAGVFEFSNAEIAAWVGFDRNPTAGEKATVRAALAEYGGL